MKAGLKFCLAVCALAFVAHLPALWAGFALDDFMLLVQNPYLRSWSTLGQLLESEFFQASGEPRHVPYYRPLSAALYFLSYQLLGQSAPLQHGLNLVLHAGVGGLLFGLLRRSRIGPRTAAFSAGTFVVHPATPDIVAYVGGRQDMLGWTCVLGGALLIARFRSSWGMVVLLSFATALLASLCREFFLAAPPLLALLVSATSRNSGPERDDRRGALVVLGAGGIGIAGVLLLRSALGIQPFRLESIDAHHLLDAAAGLGLRLLEVSVLPLDVSVGVTPPSLGTWGSMASLLVLFGASVASVHVVWRQKGNVFLALFGWTTFFVTIALHVPVLLKYDTASDRYAYGAVLGFACLLSSHIAPALPRIQAALRPGLLRPLAMAVLLALLPLTWARASEWRDERSLQAAMFRARPSDPESQLAEGLRRFYAGEPEAAYPLCDAFRKAKPKSDRAGLCLGTVLLLRGDAASAVEHLEPYVYGRPGELDARVRLFQAWFQAGNLAAVERGIAYFGQAWPSAGDIVAAREELERLRAAAGPMQER